MNHSNNFKNQATILKQTLSKDYAFSIKHSSALNIIAKLHGYKDWNILSAITIPQNNGASNLEELTDNTSLPPSTLMSKQEKYSKNSTVKTPTYNNLMISMVIHEPLTLINDDHAELYKLSMVLDLTDLNFMNNDLTYQFIYVMLNRTYTIMPESNVILIYYQDKHIATVYERSRDY